MSTENVYQHYVSQFYLKLFSNNDKSIGMYRFKDRKYIQNASIKEVCQRKYFYGKDQILEKWYRDREGEWSKVINKIIETEYLPTDEVDLYDLLSLICLSDIRTAFSADSFKDFNKKHLNICAALYKEHGREFSEKDIKRFSQSWSIQHLQSVLNTPKMVETINDLSLALIINTSSRQFVTSDTPVAKYNKLFVERNYHFSYGCGQYGILIFYPLSPTLCILLYDSNVYNVTLSKGNILKVTSVDQVQEINKLLIKNANESVFFNNTEKQWVIERAITSRKTKHTDFGNSSFGNATSGYLEIMSVVSIFDKIKLPQFVIKEPFMKCPLPRHGALMIRPTVRELEREY